MKENHLLHWGGAEGKFRELREKEVMLKEIYHRAFLELILHITPIACSAIRGESTGRLRHLHEERDSLVFLSVRDSGAGLPGGFDWRKADSLGLQFVRMLTGRLDGALEVTSEGGTMLELTFRGQNS